MSLRLLNFDFSGINNLPDGYDFPMTSWLVNSLVRSGHQVVAFSTSTGINEPIVFEGKALTICIAPRRLQHVARDFFRKEREFLSNLMLGFPVDIMNAHWTYEFALASLTTGFPTLVTIHDHALTVLRYQFDPYRFMRYLMNHQTLRRSKFMSTNSHYLWTLLTKVEKEKTVVIPDFYDSRLETFADQKIQSSNYLMSVSNGFGRRKNISNALQAFALLRRTNPELKYYLVGDGMEEGGPADQYATKKGLQTGVCFLGNRTHREVIEFLGTAKMLVHPSREESFGMSVLESMVLGTPVLGGKKSGNIPFLLDHGNCGFLCDVESPSNIAMTISEVLSDLQKAKSLAGNAKLFVKNKFSEDVVVRQYIEYYSRVIAQS